MPNDGEEGNLFETNPIGKKPKEKGYGSEGGRTRTVQQFTG